MHTKKEEIAEALLSFGITPNQPALHKMAKILGSKTIQNISIGTNNIALVGRPVPMNFSQMAKDSGTVQTLPTIGELTDLSWLENNYYPMLLGSTNGDKLLKALNGQVPNGVTASDVLLQSTDNNVFIYMAKFIEYTQALQFSTNSADGFSIGTNQAVVFSNEGIDWEKQADVSSLTSIGKVFTLSKEISFKKHFSSPGEMTREGGDGFDVLPGGNHIKSRYLFKEYLEQDFIEAVTKYCLETSNTVKGFICSCAKMNTEISDNIISIGLKSSGTIQMAFTLLV